MSENATGGRDRAGRLYTPQVLTLAVELADFPLTADLPVRGRARSQSCGSTLDVGLGLGRDRHIDRVGIQATACAVGQASAAIFARHAVGRSEAEIARGRKEIEAWLAATRTMPDWPDLETIAPAREYPARHGAILLPWRAATDALSNSDRPR